MVIETARMAVEAATVDAITTAIAIPLIIITILILFLKGTALYKAAQLKDKVWFWVLLIFNTAGILPLIYLYMKRKKKIN